MESLLKALADERRVRILRFAVSRAEPVSQAEIRAALAISNSRKSGLQRDVLQLVSAGLLNEVPRKRYVPALTSGEFEQFLEHVQTLEAWLIERGVAHRRRRVSAFLTGSTVAESRGA